jgi:sterol 3beta-glucosyltransferase
MSLLSLTNACRQDILGLHPLKASYYWGIDTDLGVPILYGYSALVLPKPTDWGDHLQVSGYWILDGPKGYQPETRLLQFLNAGSPPVYIGFGSMVDHEREVITRLIVDALDLADCRGILLGGWSNLGGEELPETILVIDYAPHEWLFPRMAAVVHHGGAGTTASGFRAGVPSIIVPFFADQFFWGWRVEQLGAGPAPIPRKLLTAEALAGAIRQALEDPEIRSRSSKQGQALRQEDGVAQGVEALEFLCGKIPFDPTS